MNKITVEAIESILKSGISIIPFVGTALNEMLFDFRGRLKQNRINQFVTTLSDFAKDELNSDFEKDKLNKEQITDLFENVLKYSSNTSSKLKHEKFSRILLDGIKNNYNSDISLKYLKFLDSINETQLVILQNLSIVLDGYVAPKGEIQIVLNRIANLNSPILWNSEIISAEEKKAREDKISRGFEHIEKLTKEMEDYEYPYLGETYNCSQNELDVYLIDLLQLGLIKDLGAKYSYDSHELFILSKTGKLFIEFLTYK